MADGGEVIFKFKGDDKDLNNTLKSIGKIGTTALKGVAVGVTAVATGFTAIVTESAKARGELQQLEGGVNKIFGDSANTVMDNAKKAFQTVGISANKYMEQVTSFSASLLQSLGGDTQRTAEYADRAMKDMADNANTFGTSIESIQNAYQGFAKQNYTMLDNLKLGYGGTKKEMERLIKDASKLTDVQNKLGVTIDKNDMSFGNIINAISVMQTQMKIAGTTSAEAVNTMTGSIATLKASWENFLSGSGDLGQVVSSAQTAFTNIMKIVNESMSDIITNLTQWLPSLIQEGSNFIGAIGQGIIDNLPMLLNLAGQIILDLADALNNNLDQIIDSAMLIIDTIVTGLANNIDKILDKGIDILIALINGISRKLPDLVPKVVEIIGKIVSTLISHLPQIIDARN